MLPTAMPASPAEARPATALPAVLVGVSAVIAFFVYALVRYLFSPGFSDHAEPSTLALAAAYVHGQPLYHGADSAARYSIMYGPLLYLLPACWFRLFGFSIFVGKLPFALAGLLAPAVLGYALYRKHGAWIALICGGALLPMLLSYRTHAFWVRPEPLVVLCVCIALWATTLATTLKRPLLAALIIGVSAGLAMSCKSYAFLLFAPICCWVGLRQLFGTVLVVGALGLAIFFSPFALPGISWSAFAYWMSLVSRHGINARLLGFHLLLGTLILTPMAGAYAVRRRRGLSLQQRLRFSAFFLAALVVGLCSGKPGAEHHYFMPFLPIMMFEVADVLAGQASWPAERGWLMLLCCEAVVCLLFSFYHGVGGLLMDDRQVHSMVTEVQGALSTYRDGTLAVGYGGTDGMGARLRMLPVFAGHPLFLDEANLMDAQFDGLAVPAATLAAIDACFIKTWLIPNEGEAFALPNLLDRRLSLDSRLKQAFRRRYQRVARLVYYDVWRCTGAP